MVVSLGARGLFFIFFFFFLVVWSIRVPVDLQGVILPRILAGGVYVAAGL